MTTKELQEKIELIARKRIIQLAFDDGHGPAKLFGFEIIGEQCAEIAQQAITEAVAEAVAEKEKKIQELYSYVRLEMNSSDPTGSWEDMLKKMQELGLISNQK